MSRLFAVIFFILSFPAGAQPDSLYHQFRSGAAGEKLLASLQLADYHRLSSGIYDSAIFYADQAIFLSGQQNLMALRCQALEMKGNTLARMRAFDEAIVVLEEAVEICGSVQEKQRLADAYNALGYVYDRQDVHDQSIDNFLKSAAINEQLGSVDKLAQAYMNVVSIFGQQEQPDKVKEYAARALKLAETVEDPGIKVGILTSGASQFAELGSSDSRYLDSALLLVERALPVSYANHFQTRISQLFNVKSAVYYIRKEYTRCLQFCDSIMKYREFAIAETLILAHIRYSDGYLGLGNTSRGLHYLDSAEMLSRELGSEFYQMIIAESKYKAYKIIGAFEPALEELEKLRTVEDSLLRIEKAELVNELEQKYETEKKELQISGLTQQNEILRLKGREQFVILLAGIIIILLLFATVFFYLKQRLNKQKEQTAIHRQQLLRSQINPHFIFNALSSIRGFLFDGRNVQEAITYLGKFAKLMRTVLELSSKEWVTLEEELKALQLYLEIQQTRFAQKFVFEIDIEKGLDMVEVYVPPLLAQPFIENAIEHGFKNVETGGMVQISCSSQDGKLLFRIQDNGIGIEHLSGPKDHDSKAIQIFRDRLELLSRKLKTKLAFTVEDLSSKGNGSGTLVVYQLPLIKNGL
ncbi:MAG: histidine kinase [Imperialibacter sp.]|uniref:histidine kinase n=1 Tax=Imperialibacter sp. TaxID=2038411 RepID=UPI0032EC8C22